MGAQVVKTTHASPDAGGPPRKNRKIVHRRQPFPWTFRVVSLRVSREKRSVDPDRLRLRFLSRSRPRGRSRPTESRMQGCRCAR